MVQILSNRKAITINLFSGTNTNASFVELFSAINSREMPKIESLFSKLNSTNINNRAFDKSLLDISIFKELPEVIDRLLDVEGLDISSGDSKGITALALALA